jgi:myo-inositol 2-dehydrogenase/D-chiro-inositol 1-dehydrogenase
MPAYRVAVIGAGRIASIHAQSAAQHRKLDLVAIVDPFGGGDLPARVSAPCFPDLDQAIEKARPDALIIASPTTTHVEYIARACDLSLPIFCEKPVAFERQATLDAISRVEAAGIPAILGFHRRHDPARQETRQRMLDGQIGRLEHILMLSRDPTPPKGATGSHLGSIVADMMIHDLDELLHLVGRLPDKVYSVIQTREPTGDDEQRIESADVLLHWHDGPVAQVSATRRAAHAFEQRLELFGSKGRLICNDPLLSPIVFDGGDDTQVARRHHHFWERYRSAYEAEIDHLAKVLVGCETPRCTFADGLRAHDLAAMVGSAAQ